MTPEPLGSNDAFRDLSSRTFEWRSDPIASLSFAGRVIDDLVTGIESFARTFESTFPSCGRIFNTPIAIGCVPWFNSDAVKEALVELIGSRGHLLLLIDKGSLSTPAIQSMIHDPRLGFHQAVIPELREWGPVSASGTPPTIGAARYGPDYSPWPGDRVIGPVRAVGWAKTKGSRNRPLLHSKALFLGAHTFYEQGGDFNEDVEVLTPVRGWIGSANWTFGATRSLELGHWSGERSFVDGLLEYLTTLIKFSEPVTTQSERPSPEMGAAVWDNDYFWQLHEASREDEYEDE